MTNLITDNSTSATTGGSAPLITVDIKVKSGVNKADLHGSVTTVVNPLKLKPLQFRASCTEEQVTALLADSRVVSVVDTTNFDETLQYDASKIVQVRRASKTAAHNTFDVVGNWGLIRHSSATNNITTMDQISNMTYTYNQDGTGVDLVFIASSVCHLDDPEFQTSGVSRIQQYDWSTLDTALPSVNYSSSATIDRHAEMVLQCAAGNTLGRATGAQIYIWPKDQMDPNGFYIYDSYDYIKAFHEAKVAAGSSRPTVAMIAMSYNWTPVQSKCTSIFYRNKKYTTVSPAGTGDTHISQLSDNMQSAFPINNGVAFGIGKWDASNISTTNHTSIFATGTDAEIQAWCESSTEGDGIAQALVGTSLQDMMDAGVHYVVSAGNQRQAIQHFGHPDYNNRWVGHRTMSSTDTNNYETCLGTNQRGTMLICKDSILAAAMDSDFTHNGNKEILSDFSNRGEAVDCCAAGTQIQWKLYGQSDDYVLDPYLVRGGGTSFSAPQIAGMVCQVLESYGSTTPKQMRRYFRDVAIGTDKLWDPQISPKTGDKYGDSAFHASDGNKGYSGNIAYLPADLTTLTDPTTLSDTSITQTSVSAVDRSLDYTIDEINTKLATVSP